MRVAWTTNHKTVLLADRDGRKEKPSRFFFILSHADDVNFKMREVSAATLQHHAQSILVLHSPIVTHLHTTEQTKWKCYAGQGQLVGWIYMWPYPGFLCRKWSLFAARIIRHLGE